MEKHQLTEFARKQRERIISARKIKEAAMAEEARKKKEAAMIEEGRKKELGKKVNMSNADDVTSSAGRPSTAATTNASSAQDQAPNLKGIDPTQQKKIINSEFMDYFGTFVTKGNVKTLPGTVNHIKAEAKRRALLN